MDDRAFYRRQFLNEHDGAAFVIASVGRVCADNQHPSVDAEFRIADCYRTVTLDFSAYGREDIEPLRTKLALVRNALVDFERALLEQLERIAAVLEEPKPTGPPIAQLTLCELTGRRATHGVCPVHEVDSCLHEYVAAPDPPADV